MRRSLLEYFFENADNTGIAFRYRPRLRAKGLTFVELSKITYQFARELERRAVMRGDRVVIWSENSPAWVAAFFGILLRGAIAVPLDEHTTAEFAAKVFEQTQPKLVLVGDEAGVASTGQIPTLRLDRLVETISNHSTKPLALSATEPEDIVEIVFTSGTTATPKGVVLTHDNILANLEPIEREIKKYIRWKFLVDPLKIVCSLPLSHVFGQMMAIFIPQMLGATVVFQNRLNPSEIASTIKRERAMVLAAVPRVLETLKHKVESEYERDGELEELLHSLQNERSWPGAWWRYRRVHRIFGFKFMAFVTGGATLDESTETFWRRLGFAVVQGYGMTETAALISLNDPFSARKGSLGKLLGGRENLKLAEDGEILVRGESISPGYWGEEETPHGNEWFATGDIGALDETGRLYFKGRKKDIIVTAAGLNIFPEDLEAVLLAQPEVLRAAVVGIDLGSGPEATAALIVGPGADLLSVIENANKKMADYQKIRHWIEWPDADFPRTPTQKIRKNVIADALMAEFTGGKSVASSSWLTGILSRYKRANNQVLLDSRLGIDLDVDSLSRVELVSEIEDRYGIDLDEAALTESATVSDIEKLVRTEGKVSEKRFSYPRWPLRFPFSWVRPVFYELVIYPITRSLAWVSTRGVENLGDLKGPVIFASNHVTYVDPALVMSAMPRKFRSRLAIAMDGERLNGYMHPPRGTRILERLRMFCTYWLVVTFFNAFPLPRRSGFRESFSFAGEAMDRGYNVLIFPEGELTKDGSIQPFKPGIGLLASGLESSIVPVAIIGLYELRKRGQRGYAKKGSVTVRFGQPIPFNKEWSAEKITSKLEDKVRELQIPAP